ncbi:hypothetical protein Tco_0149372 [Tanacetum coccineum]
MESIKKSIDERAQHKREYDIWVNERKIQTIEDKVDTGKAVDASLVNTESIGTESKEQDTSSRSGNDAHADDADIRPIYDEEPMVEVQTTAEINIFATGQQHTEQPEFNNEGKVDQNVEQCHDTCPLPAKLTDNQTTELSNQSLKFENIQEAKKKTQESCRNSEPSVMPSARSQSTTNGSKPKPRINNQKSRNWPASKSSCVTTKTVPIAEHSRNSRSYYDSKHFVCSTCHKCVFNANHDSCVTKFLNEVNSRAKVPSHKTTTRYKPVEQTSFAKKPERQIPKRHRSSIKKTSVVHEKTMTPRSCLRWKPTGKIFKTVGLRWVPTGKIFTSSTTKVDSEPTNLQDYGFNYNKIPLYCDSQSAIAISCNPVQHSRTKHIHTRYHFIKEQVENGIIELYFVRTEYQLADMFTKALPEDRFQYLVRQIGMRCLTPAELEVLTKESA